MGFLVGSFVGWFVGLFVCWIFDIRLFNIDRLTTIIK